MAQASHKKTILLGLILLSVGLFSLPVITNAATIAERVSGRILLDVYNDGEAWYVYPGTNHRYYLKNGKAALKIMRRLGVGITTANLEKIPRKNDAAELDLALRQLVSGYILLQVERNGEAWYVSPTDLKRYYLPDGKSAFRIMSEFGLGITPTDLAQIPIATDYTTVDPATKAAQEAEDNAEAMVESTTISTSRGNYNINVVTIPRSNYTMITDTANTADCSSSCAAKNLASYITENGGAFGIHGTYFCPPDYGSCAGQTNSFLPPVFNSAADTMINNGKLPFHSGPIIAFGENDEYYYYHRTEDFGNSVTEFEERTGTQLKAAIANYPSLIENGSIVVESEPLDSKQRDVKAARGAIGYNNDSVFLVTASSATVVDLASIMDSLGADYAMNLDGGGSTALYGNGQYYAGPGRELPNAIVYKHE